MNLNFLLTISLLWPAVSVQKIALLKECLTELISDENSLFFPENPAYTNVIKYWNNRLKQSTPAVVVLPRSVSAVQSSVLCAEKTGFKVSIKSGGHSYEGYSTGHNNSISIDLLHLKSIYVNKSTQTISVGGGALLSHVYWAAWSNGRFGLPGGTCPTLGIGGHSTGGGFGMFSRMYGLMADQIVEMQLVNHEGKLLKVNNQHNTDLFFALRGSGTGSFGVVTNFVFKMFKPPPTMLHYQLYFSTENGRFAEVFDAIQKYCIQMPDNLSVRLDINSTGITGSGVIIGTKELQETTFKHLLKRLPKPDTISKKSQNLIEIVMDHADLPNNTNPQTLKNMSRFHNNEFFKAKSAYFEGLLPLWLVQRFGEAMRKAPKGGIAIFNALGGKVASIPLDETAVTDRYKGLLLQLLVSHRNFKQGSLMLNWLKECFQIVQPYAKGSYINYVDADIKQGWANIYYGSNLKRLQKIKETRDPKNTFFNGASVPMPLH